MLKKCLLSVALVACVAAASASSATAGVFVRGVAPVRRAALPPYPVARRVVAAPLYRPAVVAPRVYGPVYRPVIGAPVYGVPIYSPGVSVVVGF